MSSIDFIQRVEDRIITQYSESNLLDLIKVYAKQLNEIEQAFVELESIISIDSATGAQLDNIGEIVGQSRTLIDATSISYFGFDGDPTALGFGDADDLSVGGRFRSQDEPTTGDRDLSDDEYRLFIKAKIARNHLTPTPQNIAEYFSLLFNVDIVTVDRGKMSYRVNIGRILSNDEKTLLSSGALTPEILAVNGDFLEYDSDNFFGFASNPSAQGFGDADNPDTGGKFSSLIG